MLKQGFIKLYRSLLGWEWYDDPNTLRVFLHLLLTVNYEPKQWHGIAIARGQRVCSRAVLAKELGLSEQEIRTALKHLQATGEITSHATARYSILTVSNYEKLQSPTGPEPDEKPTPIQEATGGQPQCKKAKKAKKDKKENVLLPGAKAPDRPAVVTLTLNDGSEYPVCQEQVDEWAALYPAADVVQELRKMRGWLLANPGRRKTAGGIVRFIIGWLSKEQDRGGAGKPERREYLV